MSRFYPQRRLYLARNITPLWNAEKILLSRHGMDPQKAGWQFPLITEHIHVESRDPLVAQLKHFCKVVKGMEEPRTSGEDATRTLAVAQAILKSGASGDPVDLLY